jgi:hypothetical protein
MNSPRARATIFGSITLASSLLLECATATPGATQDHEPLRPVAPTPSSSAVPVIAGVHARLEMHVPAQVQGTGDVPIELVLTNDGTEPIWVNSRMVLCAYGNFDSGRCEIWLDMTGPAGVVLFRCLPQLVPAKARDYVSVAPGEHIRRQRSLYCYLLNRRGTYSVQAHYRDQNPLGPAAPPGTTHLAEEMVTPRVTFEVEKGTPNE